VDDGPLIRQKNPEFLKRMFHLAKEADEDRRQL
jgi:hypothetical protein